MESNLHETVHFLQEFINESQLELNVSTLSVDDFESLVKNERSILNWRDKFPHYLSKNSFHMGFRLCTSADIEGAMLGVYATSSGDLHIFLIESLIRGKRNHPLSGRLTTFVVIAAIFFLSRHASSKGVYIIEPHDALIEHYRRFGFELLDNDFVMYATLEKLQSIQLLLNLELDKK